MTRAPDGSPLPRKHIAHFLDTVAWAGATIHDEGGRLVVRVVFVHCDLTAQTVERRTVDGREGEA